MIGWLVFCSSDLLLQRPETYGSSTASSELLRMTNGIDLKNHHP